MKILPLLVLGILFPLRIAAQGQDAVEVLPDTLWERLKNEAYARELSRITSLHEQYMNRCPLHRLSPSAFSLDGGEWEEQVKAYAQLERDATILRDLLPVPSRKDYTEQLYTPIRMAANLYRLHYALAMNAMLADQDDFRANEWADVATFCIRRARELSPDLPMLPRDILIQRLDD